MNIECFESGRFLNPSEVAREVFSRGKMQLDIRGRIIHLEFIKPKGEGGNHCVVYSGLRDVGGKLVEKELGRATGYSDTDALLSLDPRYRNAVYERMGEEMKLNKDDHYSVK